jgi:protein phosphatase
MDSEIDYNINRRMMLSDVGNSAAFVPLSAAVRVDVAARSRRGSARLHNEDHYLVTRLARQQRVLDSSLPPSDLPAPFDEYAYAMLVADGLGGTGRGALASRIVLSTVVHMALELGRWNMRVNREVAEQIVERAEWYYQQADRAVLERARSDPRLAGMATTLTAAYTAGDALFVASVGHSRAYLFREGALIPLTRDHTLAEHFADCGGPSSVDRGIADLKHILTDTLGGNSQQPLVEVDQYHLKNRDCVVLCTNGLTDALDDEQIANVLALRRRPAEQCDLLLDFASSVQNGATDNMTVIVAEYRIPSEEERREESESRT